MSITLYGYQYSVYTRIARIALAEKGLSYDYVETNPFSAELDPNYALLHPFKRVPTLIHQDFALYETPAITHYIDLAFSGPTLQPPEAKSMATMTQIISVIDSYAFRPMMLQLFTHRVVYPLLGMTADDVIVQEAISSSEVVLAALEEILGKTLDNREFLCGNELSLADIHLAPVIDYLVETEEGSALLMNYKLLTQWWNKIKLRSSIINTRPILSNMAKR